jgi:DNA-binding LacI/PurR family transcriptional regulator
VTIVDVARHAGVSTTAVSKVVRNASGTSAQIRSRGRHGPAAGYDVVADDDFTFAAFGPVSLTTVDQAGREIGATAARLLLDRLADRDRPASVVTYTPPAGRPAIHGTAGLISTLVVPARVHPRS